MQMIWLQDILWYGFEEERLANLWETLLSTMNRSWVYVSGILCLHTCLEVKIQFECNVILSNSGFNWPWNFYMWQFYQGLLKACKMYITNLPQKSHLQSFGSTQHWTAQLNTERGFRIAKKKVGEGKSSIIALSNYCSLPSLRRTNARRPSRKAGRRPASLRGGLCRGEFDRSRAEGRPSVAVFFGRGRGRSSARPSRFQRFYFATSCEPWWPGRQRLRLAFAEHWCLSLNSESLFVSSQAIWQQ